MNIKAQKWGGMSPPGSVRESRLLATGGLTPDPYHQLRGTQNQIDPAHVANTMKMMARTKSKVKPVPERQPRKNHFFLLTFCDVSSNFSGVSSIFYPPNIRTPIHVANRMKMIPMIKRGKNPMIARLIHIHFLLFGLSGLSGLFELSFIILSSNKGSHANGKQNENNPH